MKKVFTLLMGAAFCTAMTASAQTTILKEDFESVTVPDLPNGWTQFTKDTAGWRTHKGQISFTSSQTGWIIPAHTNYAVIDDWNKNLKNDSTSLITPAFDLTGISGAYLNLDYSFIKAQYNGGKPVESAYIKVTTDGAATWTYIDTLEGKSSVWQNIYVSLSAFNNTNNVQIGFEYNDGGDAAKPLFYLAVDNIHVFKPAGRDAWVKTINLPTLGDTDKIGIGGTLVKVSVMNYGSDTIKELDVEYNIDGGTPVTQAFTGLSIPTFGTTELTFTNALPNTAAGQHTIAVKATSVNTNTDDNTTNNEETNSLIVASNSVGKDCIIEEFTSSTCPPCASFNSSFDPLVKTNNGNKPGSGFNVIKYQMNWPNPGNDASYNAHGNSRKEYYGVGGIPDHYTNGKAGASGNQAEIDGCKGGQAFAKITGTYNVDMDSMWGEITVTPYFSFTRNYRVFIAILEEGYWNEKNTTGQREYKHVMRRMFPDGNGYGINAVADNTPVSYKFNAPVVIGDVKQGNFNLWSHPRNTEIVAFIQDPATGDILQSFSLMAEWPVQIDEVNSIVKEVALYPNPAADQTSVGFRLDKASEVQLQVTDAVGKVVYSSISKLDAGFNELSINTSKLNSGIYNVRIGVENNTIVKRLSVIN